MWFYLNLYILMHVWLHNKWRCDIVQVVEGVLFSLGRGWPGVPAWLQYGWPVGGVCSGVSGDCSAAHALRVGRSWPETSGQWPLHSHAAAVLKPGTPFSGTWNGQGNSPKHRLKDGQAAGWGKNRNFTPPEPFRWALPLFCPSSNRLSLNDRPVFLPLSFTRPRILHSISGRISQTPTRTSHNETNLTMAIQSHSLSHTRFRYNCINIDWHLFIDYLLNTVNSQYHWTTNIT